VRGVGEGSPLSLQLANRRGKTTAPMIESRFRGIPSPALHLAMELLDGKYKGDFGNVCDVLIGVFT